MSQRKLPNIWDMKLWKRSIGNWEEIVMHNAQNHNAAKPRRRAPKRSRTVLKNQAIQCILVFLRLRHFVTKWFVRPLMGTTKSGGITRVLGANSGGFRSHALVADYHIISPCLLFGSSWYQGGINVVSRWYVSKWHLGGIMVVLRWYHGSITVVSKWY